MYQFLHFLLALVVILALAWLVSFDRRNIRIRYIIQLIVIEIALAFFFLHAESGLFVIQYVSGFFESLLKYAAEGTNFVFGGMGEKGLAFIFLGVLCPIIFISALIGILQHWRILPVIIRVVGTLLSKVNGMGKLESFNRKISGSESRSARRHGSTVFTPSPQPLITPSSRSLTRPSKAPPRPAAIA